MQATGTRAGEGLTGAPLDNDNFDPRQRQLARQHQPRRTSAGNHDRMLAHRRIPAGITHFVLPIQLVVTRLSGTKRCDRGLPASPRCATYEKWKERVPSGYRPGGRTTPRYRHAGVTSFG